MSDTFVGTGYRTKECYIYNSLIKAFVGYARGLVYIQTTDTDTTTSLRFQSGFHVAKNNTGDNKGLIALTCKLGSYNASWSSKNGDSKIRQKGAWKRNDKTFTITKTHAQQTFSGTLQLTIMSNDGLKGDVSEAFPLKIIIPARTSSTLKYDANGGTGAPGSQTKWAGENLKLQTGKPTRTGYTFKGWATSKAGAAVYQPGGTYSTEIGKNGATLYAVWEIIKYTITYNANGGANAPGNQTRNYGDNNFKLQPGRPTRTGYTFKGWATSKTGGVAYQPSQSYTTNAGLNLYAVWEIIKYTITYNANGGTGAPGNQTKNYGTDISLSPIIPTREGYNFQGWATSPTGGVVYTPNQVYSNNANLNLYAVWGKKTYTITYNANGGTGAPENQIKEHGKNIYLRYEIPKYQGYEFKGWATTPIGLPEYQPSDYYTENANLNLYAVWSLTNKITMYDESGKPCSGQVHFFGEDKKLKKCAIYFYGSDGKRKGTG